MKLFFIFSICCCLSWSNSILCSDSTSSEVQKFITQLFHTIHREWGNISSTKNLQTISFLCFAYQNCASFLEVLVGVAIAFSPVPAVDDDSQPESKTNLRLYNCNMLLGICFVVAQALFTRNDTDTDFGLYSNIWSYRNSGRNSG